MNTENLESIYQKVAMQLNNIIPEPWKKSNGIFRS